MTLEEEKVYRYRNKFVDHIVDFLVENKIKTPDIYNIPDDEFEFLKSSADMWFMQNQTKKIIESRG